MDLKFALLYKSVVFWNVNFFIDTEVFRAWQSIKKEDVIIQFPDFGF